MNVWFGVSVLLTTVAAAWSREPVRDRLLNGAFPSIDDWLERWLSLVLPLATLGCLCAGVWSMTPDLPGSPVVSIGTSAPAAPKTTQRATASSLAALPDTMVSTPCQGVSVTGRIVRNEEGDQPVPIAGAAVRVGPDGAISTSDGSFEVPLCSKPTADALVQVSHAAHLTRFLRIDDPLIARHRPISLASQMRVVVVDVHEKGSLAPDEDRNDFVRSTLERQLASSWISILADDRLRDELVSKLHQYQENRALYHPATLQRVGQFHGATHGIFWSIRKVHGGLQLESKLVNFRTSRVEQTSVVAFKEDGALPDAAVYLADRLLAQLADVKILSPKTGGTSGRKLNLEGYALFHPKSWTLWVTVLPVGNNRHYPQQEITVKDDGSWFASSVYIGPEESLHQPQAFRVYLVLADPERTASIRHYLNEKRLTGIDLSAWDGHSRRVLDHVQVTRKDSATN